MIRYLRKKEIDIEKYDNCIHHASNSRLYAYSWFLNIVASDWSCLILNDYEAVMPIPYVRTKRSLYIKKILQPNFCQQLGVFYREELDPKIFSSFIESFLELKPDIYCFNTDNPIFSSKFSSSVINRVNYELELNKPYQLIKNDYSKNLKRNLVKATNFELKISNEIAIADIISMKKRYKKHKLSKNIYVLLNMILTTCIQMGIGKPYAVLHEGQYIASAFFIQSNHRLIHFLSTSTETGKQMGAIPYLFDDIIKEHADASYIFDFEGSMISGLARFFKSFGSEASTFYMYKKK